MRMPSVAIAVEGPSDAAVARRLLRDAGLEATVIYGQNGKGDLDRHLNGYNNAARYASWFVLRDLDHDADCAPDLVADLLPTPSRKMCFRVAVRATEAWLLADADAIADFLAVSRSLISADPESLADPKRYLVDISRKSRRREVRADMVPAAGTTAKQGPGYTGRIIEFSDSYWRPQIAKKKAASLAGCMARLRKIATAR